MSSAAYEPFGPISSIVYGNGTAQTLTYTDRYFPHTNELTDGTTLLSSYGYSEDAVGNITAITDELNAGYDRAFGYNDLNRLTTANSGADLWGTATGNGYTYDAMGNVLSVQLGSTTRSFSYYPNAQNQNLPEVLNATENGVTTPISYDYAGNNAGGGVYDMYYDAREQMVDTDLSPG